MTQTTDWLDWNGIPYRDLCFMKDKEQVGADIYVDDSPDNIRLLRDQGFYTICFANSTNRELGPPIAANWSCLAPKTRGRVRADIGRKCRVAVTHLGKRTPVPCLGLLLAVSVAGCGGDSTRSQDTSNAVEGSEPSETSSAPSPDAATADRMDASAGWTDVRLQPLHVAVPAAVGIVPQLRPQPMDPVLLFARHERS